MASAASILLLLCLQEYRKRDNWLRSLCFDICAFACRIPNVFLLCMPDLVSSLTTTRSGDTVVGQQQPLSIQFGSISLSDMVTQEQLEVAVETNFRKTQEGFCDIRQAMAADNEELAGKLDELKSLFL